MTSHRDSDPSNVVVMFLQSFESRERVEVSDLLSLENLKHVSFGGTSKHSFSSIREKETNIQREEEKREKVERNSSWHVSLRSHTVMSKVQLPPPPPFSRFVYFVETNWFCISSTYSLKVPTHRKKRKMFLAIALLNQF